MNMPNLIKATLIFWHKLNFSLCQNDCIFFFADKRHFSGKSKYPLSEKMELAKVVAKCKEQYEKEIKKRWDPKLKRVVMSKPREGFYAKAVREFYSDLKTAHYSDEKFKKALAYATRSFNAYRNEDGEPSKKRFRIEGGGRKAHALEFRDMLFEWFIGKSVLAYSLDSNEYASSSLLIFEFGTN